MEPLEIKAREIMSLEEIEQFENYLEKRTDLTPQQKRATYHDLYNQRMYLEAVRRGGQGR